MMDALSNDGVPPPSGTQALPKKKKILPTVGPIGWSDNFKKPKKSSRISLPELPPSSAENLTPSTPAQQPPKKKRQVIVPQLPPSPAANPTPSAPSQQPPKKKKRKISNQPPLTSAPDPSLEATPGVILTPTQPHEIKNTSSNLRNPEPTHLNKKKKATRVSLPVLPPSSAVNPMPSTPSEQPPKKKKQKFNNDSLNSVSKPLLQKTPGLIPTPTQPHQTQNVCTNLEKPNPQPILQPQLLSPSLDQSATINADSQGSTDTSQLKPNQPVWPSLDSFSNLTPQEILARFATTAPTTPSVKKRKKSQAISGQPVAAPNQSSSASVVRKNRLKASTGEPDQNEKMPEATPVTPPSLSNLSKSVYTEPQKPDEQAERSSTSTSIPLTAPNLLQATNSQTQAPVRSENSQPHQTAFSQATGAVTDQDRSSNPKFDGQIVIGAAEPHSLNVPEQTCVPATKKERVKAKAKQKKLAKKESLRSGSVSTTQTTQEAKCFSSVSTSPRPMQRDFHVPSRQSTPISMVKVPKHFGRWELSMPSDRDVPMTLLARMHQFLDEAVCAGFAKPIFRDPTLTNTEPAPMSKVTASNEFVSDINRSKQLDKLSTDENPTHVVDESNCAAPKPRNLFPAKTSHLAIEAPATIPDNQRKRTFSVCSSSLSEDINNTVMMTLGLEESYETDQENDSINNQAPKGLAVDSNPKIIEPPPSQLEENAVTEAVSGVHAASSGTDLSSSHLSKPGHQPNSDNKGVTSDNGLGNNSPAKEPPVTSADSSEANSSEASSPSGASEIVTEDTTIQPPDRAPSDKLESTISTLSLPQPEPNASASPISNKTHTKSVSESDSSSEDESDSSPEDGAPPSAQRPPPRKSASVESSSSDDEASSTTSSHHASPANPPSQPSSVAIGYAGRTGLYKKGPMAGRRKTLDTFRPLDFTLNTPQSIGLPPLSTDPKNRAGHSDKESSSTSDDDDSDSDSSDTSPMKKPDKLPLGLPAHKLAGSTASAKPNKSTPSTAKNSSTDPNKKSNKSRKSLVKFWATEEAKIIKSKKKA
ncbi:hypothetical protein PTTG_12090 [Puccinia triticina 1-1 BBBD Race 1]|uniref:Uncharacterized protein n=1 Tax=Puccinia triticina (isolate 1-1 / race 1 (BBBD)) TaxID=630390 RepID=A0A180GNR5_PUCT1|nr:hypothetical protein PTTG_12090 [Puccinia triticina 1-1 BBBD Race 1]